MPRLELSFPTLTPFVELHYGPCRSSDKEQEALLPLFRLAVPTDGGVAVWLTAQVDDDRLVPHVRLVLTDGTHTLGIDLAPTSAVFTTYDGAHGRWRTFFWTATTPQTAAVVTALHLRILVPEHHAAPAAVRVGAIRVAASAKAARLPPTPWLETAVPCTGLIRTAARTGVSWTLLQPSTIAGCHVLVDGHWMGYTGGTVWNPPSGGAVAGAVRIVPVRHDGWTWRPDACPVLA